MRVCVIYRLADVGGSAHLTAHVALYQGYRVHVLTRGEANRRLAGDLGVGSVGDTVVGYDRDLFDERVLRSVTANTRAADGQFLQLADRLTLCVTTTAYSMTDASRAPADLVHGRFSGAAVLHNWHARLSPVDRLAF